MAVGGFRAGGGGGGGGFLAVAAIGAALISAVLEVEQWKRCGARQNSCSASLDAWLASRLAGYTTQSPALPLTLRHLSLSRPKTLHAQTQVCTGLQV